MRALCGAIITAGALIGLGMTAIGFGQRYSLDHPRRVAEPGVTADAKVSADAQPVALHLSQMDRPLVFMLVFLTGAAVVGLGITFVGLAYHQIRREREYRLHLPAAGSRIAT